jgi:hypothetical protein
MISLQSIERRAFIENVKFIREGLHQKDAVYLGTYAFIDHIYIQDPLMDLNKEFIRIREYLITQRQQKPILAVHKIRDPIESKHNVFVKFQGDLLEEAIQTIPSNFSHLFSFFRTGWEYLFNDLHLFIEEIEGLPPSVEIIAPSEDKILDFFKVFSVKNILEDSVAKCIQKSKVKPSTHEEFSKEMK